MTPESLLLPADCPTGPSPPATIRGPMSSSPPADVRPGDCAQGRGVPQIVLIGPTSLA